MISLVILTIILILCILSLIKYNKLDKKCNIPGPSPLPIVGNTIDFLGDQARLLKTLGKYHERYGSISRAYLFSLCYISINHPKYIEPILSSTQLIVKGKSYDFIRPWLGNGLLTSSGYRWRTYRKFLTPAFHFNILPTFLPIFCKNEKILVKKLQTMIDVDIDFFPLITLTALDNVTESIMGVDLNVQSASESKYVTAIAHLVKILMMKIKNPAIAEDVIFNLTPYKTVQDKALHVIHNQTSQIIETRRQQLKQSSLTGLPNDTKNDFKYNKHAFLDLLLLATIDGKAIDDESIREEVDTFMFEGHDTTASGIVFTLYCLSKHKEAQEKILIEQRTILGDDFKRDPTLVELQQMKYLELVIKESLRLYPPVPLIERKVTQECDLLDSRLPKNASLIVDIFHLQRNPAVFENPLDFIPERFDTPSKNPFAWVPFSAGPRNCIGQKFAIMEMKVTISAVIKSFKLLPSNVEPNLCAEFILKSTNGVYIKCQPRY